MQDIQKWTGKRIRELRLRKKISQEELAHLSGVNRSHMGKIERGEVNLGVATLYIITKALGVPLSVVFKGVE
jgi:transcriptional regulator with XRE-family HTH domain